jgi:hypothetical protein
MLLWLMAKNALLKTLLSAMWRRFCTYKMYPAQARENAQKRAVKPKAIDKSAHRGHIHQ